MLLRLVPDRRLLQLPDVRTSNRGRIPGLLRLSWGHTSVAVFGGPLFAIAKDIYLHCFDLVSLLPDQ